VLGLWKFANKPGLPDYLLKLEKSNLDLRFGIKDYEAMYRGLFIRMDLVIIYMSVRTKLKFKTYSRLGRQKMSEKSISDTVHRCHYLGLHYLFFYKTPGKGHPTFMTQNQLVVFFVLVFVGTRV
jgi:hypothetical protein